MANAGSRRLFFALWPDAATRRAVAAVSRSVTSAGQGKPVPPDNYHITLVFLGAVASGRFDDVCAAARAVRCAPFTLMLDRFGFWARHRLWWLGPGETPPELQDLVESLWTALTPLGFEREQRIFKPHVSLCRKLQQQPELKPRAPVCWPANGFALVESQAGPQGSLYKVVAHFGQAHSVTH